MKTHDNFLFRDSEFLQIFIYINISDCPALFFKGVPDSLMKKIFPGHYLLLHLQTSKESNRKLRQSRQYFYLPNRFGIPSHPPGIVLRVFAPPQEQQ
jgi:hypothetical protein